MVTRLTKSLRIQQTQIGKLETNLREYDQENQPIHPDGELQARSKKGFMAGQGEDWVILLCDLNVH